MPGRPRIWITVRQGLTAFAVGGGGVVWTFLLSSIFLSSFSLSLGDGPIYTKLLSQRAVKPKTTNQPTWELQLVCGRPTLALSFKTDDMDMLHKTQETPV